MRVVVVGAGHVGLPCAVALASAGHSVTAVEVDQGRRQVLIAGRVPFAEPGLDGAPLAFTGVVDVGGADVVVLAVPTPATDAGPDLAAWREVTAAIRAGARPGTLVLVKSTVPPGTADTFAAESPDLRVVSNPEFLRVGSALDDLRRPARVVLGGDPADCEIAAKIWRGIVADGTPFVVTTRRTAELAKLAANAMLAVRVAFANELTDLAADTGADVDALWRAVALDPRIGPAHLRPSPGFGGPCLPKDVRLLVHGASGLGLLRAAEAGNHARAAAFVERLATCPTVAVWGTGFRPGTAADAGSVPAWIVHTLRDRGVRVIVWEVGDADDGARSVRGADALFVGSAVAPAPPDALEPRTRLVLDPAGLLPAGRWASAGWVVSRSSAG